jgi:hypothetical protein
MGGVPMFCLLADTDDSYLVLPARLGADCFGNLLINGNPHDCDRRLSFSRGDGGSVEGEKQRPPLASGRHRAAGRCTASGCFSSEPSTRNCPPLNEGQLCGSRSRRFFPAAERRGCVSGARRYTLRPVTIAHEVVAALINVAPFRYFPGRAQRS